MPKLVAMTTAVVRHLTEAGAVLGNGNRVLLTLALAGFVLAPSCTGAAWYAAARQAGGRLTLVVAWTFYGAGSIVNALLPARAGDATRLALFGRSLPRTGAIAAVGALAELQGARLAINVALAAVGAAADRPELLALAGVVAIACALRARQARTPLVVLVVCSTAARVFAFATLLAGVGVGSPVRTACALVPALAIAGTLPLLPGNLGLGTAAATAVLHARGASVADGVAISLAIHALETAAALLFSLGALICLAATCVRSRVVTVASPLRRPPRGAGPRGWTRLRSVANRGGRLDRIDSGRLLCTGPSRLRSLLRHRSHTDWPPTR